MKPIPKEYLQEVIASLNDFYDEVSHDMQDDAENQDLVILKTSIEKAQESAKALLNAKDPSPSQIVDFLAFQNFIDIVANEDMEEDFYDEDFEDEDFEDDDFEEEEEEESETPKKITTLKSCCQHDHKHDHKKH